MIHFKYLLICLSVLSIVSCGKEEDKSKSPPIEVLETQNSETKTNVIVFLIPGMDQDLFSILLDDPNSENLRKFKDIGSYAPISYFDNYSDYPANITALMSGKSTLFGHLGLDKDSMPNRTWISEFKEADYQVSYITDKSLGSIITGAIFTGNQSEIPQNEKAALNMVRFEPDFIWGMGTNLFKRRSDKKNLFEEMAVKNYKLKFSLKNIEIKSDQKFAGVFNNYTLPDSVDLIEKGLENWSKIRDKESHILILSILDLEGILKSKDKNNLYNINRYLDFIVDTEDFDSNPFLFLIINPFNKTQRSFNLSKGDTLDFNSNTIEYNQLNNNIWAFGNHSESFSGYYQNVDLYKKISGVLKK